METDTPEEGRRSHRLEGGKSADFAAARELVVHLPEWGRIEIRSGAAEVREKQQALETAKENLAAALRELGTERFEDLEVACARARELDADLKNLRQGIGDVLGRFGSADDLRRTVREEEAALGKLLESNAAGDGPDGCDPDELRRRDRENERKRQSLEEEHAAKQREAEQLRRDLTANSRECGEAEGERNRLRTAAVVLETRLKEMAERYGDGGLEEARRRAGREFVQAEARLEEAKRLLPEDWEALPGRRDRAVKAASEAGAEHDRRREALLRMEGEMRQRGSEGLYSREVRLREKIALKREEAGALRRRSGAAGFLATLLGFRKREAFERVLAPLEEQLSVQFGELTGRRERRVFLDENLQVTGVGRDRESGIPFESLSQGAREQLLLALRAAVALELAEEEPQVLILDDVLVNTDPTRQQRVLDFLESLARRVQILVLTCHPDRYRGVGQRLALHPVREDETGTPG